MRVSLVSSGGFTGQRLAASLDTDELPAAQAAEALTALKDLASSPPTISPGASSPRYRLTFADADEERTVELTEFQIPSAVRPLVTELVKRARSGA
jgi:hypothetical protein